MTTIPDPTSLYKPDMKGGSIIASPASAFHVADLMLRYGSVEVRMRTKAGNGRSVFFASRQHSVYTDGEVLISTRLPEEYHYYYYNFGIMYGEGKLYQFTTDGTPTLVEPWLSDEEVHEWTAFLARVNNAVNTLMHSPEYRAYGAGSALAPDGRVRLRLRQHEEA